MSLKVRVNPEYAPIPEGTYPAVCYAIADCGMQRSEMYNKTSHEILFIWEIADDDLRIEVDGQMRRRAISKQYTASFADKSNMYKDLRPWIGREFTAEESEGAFDVGSLIGKGCMLSVVSKKGGDGKARSRVSGVAPLPKGMDPGPPENPTVVYDMDESPEEALDMLPEWARNRIAGAVRADAGAANSVDVRVDPDTGEVTMDPAARMGATRGVDSELIAIARASSAAKPAASAQLDDLP
jgi:hypothetical protein